jgi:hypothetical protein
VVRLACGAKGSAFSRPTCWRCRRSTGGPAGNQAEELLRPLGYQVAYEARTGDNCGDPGIAVASRLPILARRLLERPSASPVLAVRVESTATGGRLSRRATTCSR